MLEYIRIRRHVATISLYPLRYSLLLVTKAIRGKRKQEYIAAVQAGAIKNFQPMMEVFRTVISRSLRNVGENRQLV